MKDSLKSAANLFALALVCPAFGCYWLAMRFVGPERVFSGWSQTFSLFPGLIGVYLRRAFYRLSLNQCAGDSCVTFGTVLSHCTASIGRRVYVGPFCCLGDVALGDDVLLGSHVSIANGSRQHGTDRLDIPIREQPGEWPRIHVGCDTWIGDRAVVLADVGRHCVVGAGAVVVRPIPDYAVAVGVPAKVVRFRTTVNSDCNSSDVVLNIE
jgi:acetyltransferase-like isoleucine patch superfamily enzyme